MNMGQITKTDINIILILAGLSFCICFGLSSPSLSMNDEWITTNQLNQVFSGAQLIENEGKYGRLFTGEMGAYFTTRDNYLAYSLMLPVLAVPSLYVIVTAGDSFRLLFLILWFIIGAGSLLTGARLASQYNYKQIEYVILLILCCFFGLFLLNLYFYQPFESSWEDSPIESAAIIITNNFLFCFIPSMIYCIFRSVQLSRIVSLIGALSVICCSSYLYWAGSAKDHLLIAFLITLFICIFTIKQVKRSTFHIMILFIVGGLICWARPEYGAFLLFGLIVWEMVSLYYKGEEENRGILRIFRDKEFYTCICSVFIGLIPFFINNILITKNPFIPPQYLYVANSRTQIPSAIQNLDSVHPDLLHQINIYFHQIVDFFSPAINDIILDFYRLFWISPNGGIGILFFCPIIIPALIYGIKTRKDIIREYPKERVNLLIFCFFLMVLTFLAYARVIHGSTISEGSLPDMRYFSPIYLPMSVVSVILLSPLFSVNSKHWLHYSFYSVVIISPLLTIGYTFVLLKGFSLLIHISLMIKLLLVMYLIITLCATINPKFWSSKYIFPILYAILLIIPSSIQLMIILLYSHVKMNGYPFWQPVLEYLFTYVLQIII